MIYFKIVNHSAKTDYEIFEIKNLQNNTFYGTSRSYLNFNNSSVELINNVWYSFEDVLKKCGLSNSNITDLKYPNYVKGYYDYLNSNSISTYYLGYLDVYEVSNKYDTKGTNVGRWAESSYKNKNDGIYINFKFGDATLNDSRDRYFIIHSGNPLSDPANNPLIKWNGILGKLNIDYNKKLYSNLIDTNVITSNTNFNIVFTDNYNLSIYKNGYLLETSNINKNDSRTYNLRPNDVLEFKKATETIPPKPKPEPPKPTPVYYNLPSVSHVTFNPNKAELGKMTPIKVTVENGYTINDLTFSADNPNTVTTIFTSSYKDGIINLDLTSFDPTDKSSAEELITVKQNITKIVHKDWLIPSATNITFTSGGTTISTVKLGEYTNIYLNLDDHYTWNDNNQGKGLVLNDGTVLGSWNGKNTFGLNLEKYLDPEQLQSAHWDLNYTKTDFSDEHSQQIPIKLDLVHCKSDTNSILENSSKTVTLTADNGYIFDDDVIYYYYDDENSYYAKLTKKANKQNTVSFEIAVGSYHDYQQEVSYENDLPSIKAVATKPDAIPTGTKSINIYDMSDGEINTTMNSLVQKFGENGPETVDFTQFINQIYRIPFNIPNDLTEDVDKIEVGKYSVDVKTKQVNQDKLIIDGGSITVEPHYKNANDYSPIECVLYLPFTKEVNLNINDIINHTINIKYNIDLLSGATTIIVSNENNEIYTGQFNISTSLEFYGLYEDKVVNRLNSTYINDILQAYIKLIYNKPIENLVSYETMEHGILKDYHGFTKISNIDLQGTYNYNESTEIIELLKQGVFINGVTRN